MIKILFVADTHLGFDLPFRPRIQRRRRGGDFFDNFERSLEPAFRGEVDCVVHGGDLLYRSKVPARLVQMAFEPLCRAADHGIPVYVVPGNHERSRIPFRLLAAHPHIHIFDRGRTFLLKNKDYSLALVGFPYVRENVRQGFAHILEQTGWRSVESDARVLCIHHCVEGATVSIGVRDFTFRSQPDVIRAADIPGDFAAVLSGHIHRFQVLTRDLQGRALAAPILYPGSCERTSFSEKDEEKGYLTVEVGMGDSGRGNLRGWHFHKLPTRPMVQLPIQAADLSARQLQSRLRQNLTPLSPDSIVQLRIHGPVAPQALPALSAASLRSLAPPTMNLTLTFKP
jgi:exonuclease SbcD